ncbi:MAG: MFS transporter [Ornithinimicrobium sp.]
MTQSAERPRWLRRGLVIAGIVALAANLRGPISGVGPVLDRLTADLSLSAVEVSLLTAAPVLCFGIFAVLTPRLTSRLGVDATAALALLILTLGLLLRSAGLVSTLFIGTVLVSAAIAVGNVLLPVLVKRDAPRHPGLMTGAYTTTLTGSAAIGAAITVPLTSAYGWGIGLGVWVVTAAVALALWAPRARGGGPHHPVEGAGASAGGMKTLLRVPLAWQVTTFFGLQSAIFYAMLAWLPSIYRAAGISASSAGLLLAVATLSGIPMALLIPSWAAHSKDQRYFPVVLSAVAASGFLGLLIAPTAIPVLWAVLIGTGLGGNFPLVLTLIVLRTDNPDDTSSLSTMAQGLGYLVAAAVGPFAVGVLHDLTGGWTWPVVALVVLAIPQSATGWAAGRARVIGDRQR